jgi:sec-independent protein translocase protein TatA
MTPLAFINNIAGPQGWIILLVVVLLFGAKKLPELAKAVGQSMKEFQKGKEGVEDTKPETPERIEPPKSA